MPNGLMENIYNPDVLSCIANLSNDEVFTPPEVANAMLDLLPKELFESKETKFLDPACKSGVYLREIAKRLIRAQFPDFEVKTASINEKKSSGEQLNTEETKYLEDLQIEIDHVFKKQLFGIAITELTSLLSRRSVYCSKYPQGDYSVTKFDNPEGNIFYKEGKHLFINKKCLHCGASEEIFGASKREGLESHAYQFIHPNSMPGELEDMQFDVIIGNPPYQLEDAGNGKSAKPIYHLFIEQAKKLKPRYLSMIIPSRWFTGGKGLDDFRKNMLSDQKISKLVDYENFKDVFPGVDLAGGACYFLWDRDYKGDCEVVNYHEKTPTTLIRSLNEYDVFIRQNKSVPIVRNILSKTKDLPRLSERISSRKPFGLPTNYDPKESGVPCWFIQKIGLKFADKKDIDDTNKYLDKWKFIVPKSPIAGQTDFTKPVGFYYEGNTKISKPGECCTESFIVLGAFESKEEVESYRSYIMTKIVRFLLLQAVVSQDVTKKNYCFVPDLKTYDQIFTDKELCEKWDISEDDWNYIDSRICNIKGQD